MIYLSRAYHFISPIVQARTSRPSRTTASSTTVRARLWVRWRFLRRAVVCIFWRLRLFRPEVFRQRPDVPRPEAARFPPLWRLREVLPLFWDF